MTDLAKAARGSHRERFHSKFHSVVLRIFVKGVNFVYRGARHYTDEGTYGRWQCLYGCTKTADGLVKRPSEKPAERERVTTEEEVEHVRKEYNLNHLENSRHPMDKGKT